MINYRTFTLPSLSAAVLCASAVLYFTGPTGAMQTPVKAPAVSISALETQVIAVGQPFRFRVEAEAARFVHVYRLSRGKTYALAENIPVSGSETISFPWVDFNLAKAKVSGQEKILVYATRTRLVGEGGRRAQREPVELYMSHAELREVLQRKMRHLPASDWAYAETYVRVDRR